MALEPLSGLRVVDLFAGSGALGIEALSRGAIHADFVEHDHGARAALSGNLVTLSLEARARVWNLVLPGGLNRMQIELAAADLVLADPPYGGGAARAIVIALGREHELKSGALVVVEHHAKDEVPERAGCLIQVRERRYGETAVTTYQAGAGHGSLATEENRP